MRVWNGLQPLSNTERGRRFWERYPISALKARSRQSWSDTSNAMKTIARDELFQLLAYQIVVSGFAWQVKWKCRRRERNSRKHKSICWKGWRVVRYLSCHGEERVQMYLFWDSESVIVTKKDIGRRAVFIAKQGPDMQTDSASECAETLTMFSSNVEELVRQVVPAYDAKRKDRNYVEETIM